MISSMAATRLECWALLLVAHDYTITYRCATDHYNANGLSRPPLLEHEKEKQGTIDTFLINHIKSLPICCTDVSRETRFDTTLSLDVEMVSAGRFPSAKDIDNSLAPYLVWKDELTVHQGCLKWGNRIVIPTKLSACLGGIAHRIYRCGQDECFGAKLHVVTGSGHTSGGEMLDLRGSCHRCQKSPSLIPLHPWPWPTAPWQRIHIDFAGPFEGRRFLVVVGTYSKWPEIILLDSTTSA